MSVYMYVLNEAGEPVPEPDAVRWGEWMEESRKTGARIVAKTGLPEQDALVSTVFLGLDLGASGVLWETMILGGPHDKDCWRYRSVEEARIGHAHAVRVAAGEVEE